MTLSVRSYRPEDAVLWDGFCKDSLQATFLHTRRFLSYHGERFEDRSLILEMDGKVAGLFPAALNPLDVTHVVSHPGITYGGIIHDERLRGERIISALNAIRLHYVLLGLQKLSYKVVPSIYHQTPAQDDLYGLFRLGALRSRCDLSSTIDLCHRLSRSERRRRSLKKAIKAGVVVTEDARHLPALWEVVIENLQRKHSVSPVHDLREICLLRDLFPENIRSICGLIDNKVVAGVLVFITATTYHAQYIASSDIGYDVSALDAVFDFCIASAQGSGKRWFDFGISTESMGMVLNEGLYQFKSEFGAGGVVQEFFDLDLRRACRAT